MDNYEILYDDAVNDEEKACHVIQKVDYNYGTDVIYHFYVRNVSRDKASDIASAMNAKERGK